MYKKNQVVQIYFILTAAARNVAPALIALIPFGVDSFPKRLSNLENAAAGGINSLAGKKWVDAPPCLYILCAVTTARNTENNAPVNAER